MGFPNSCSGHAPFGFRKRRGGTTSYGVKENTGVDRGVLGTGQYPVIFRQTGSGSTRTAGPCVAETGVAVLDSTRTPCELSDTLGAPSDHLPRNGHPRR